MSEDPWGVDVPPAVPAELPPLPAHLAELAELVTRGGRRFLEAGEDFVRPRAADLPEVQALAAEGWHPAPDDPMSCCLPAVWPAEHRCWVPDRLPRICSVSGGGRSWLEPLDEDDVVAIEADVAEAARDCGLPPPPPGRLWLLRSPWPTLGLEVVLTVIRRRRAERDLEEGAAGTAAAAADLLAWDEEEVWAWWRGPAAEAALAWRRLGRVGDDVAGLVMTALDPTMTGRLQTPVADGGAGLTEAQVVAWADAVNELGEGAAESVRAWRALGLPADPPRDDSRVLATMTPADVAEWLAADFSFEEVGRWRGAGLDLAVRWRASGFTATETRELLAADWTVTPEEALAFDAAGIDPRARLRWLEAGFAPAQARAWTDLDVLPQEARVWRSLGRSPEDARPHRAAGGGALPPDANVGWFGYGNGARPERVYAVTDPPGTRGSLAAEAERGPRR